jgi:hypothetical protein
MAERTCDACGKKKDVHGGKVCSNGHFICKDCVPTISVWDLFSPNMGPDCPLCGKPLK